MCHWCGGGNNKSLLVTGTETSKTGGYNESRLYNLKTNLIV